MALDPNHIDGDRLLAFIRAVQDIGKMLESLNIIEVREYFMMGRKHGSIEHILTLQKQWKESLDVISVELRNNATELEKTAATSRQCITLLKNFIDISSRTNDANARLKDMCDLLDRLERHRSSGMLDLLAALSKPENGETSESQNPVNQL